MIKTFQIDFVRAIFEEVIKDNANKVITNDQFKIYDFYEHLASDEEVERYVETFRELTDQQNQTDIKFFGVLSVSDTPSITNLRTAFISPFEWQLQVRTTVAYKEDTLNILYNIIDRLKGRKVDIAQFEDGTLLPVGTITNEIKNGDFLGGISALTNTPKQLYEKIIAEGITSTLKNGDFVYFETYNVYDKKHYLTKYTFNEELQDFYKDSTFKEKAFDKYKLDLSFDDIKLDEPMVLNGEETVWFIISGGATLTENKVMLGNDFVRFAIRRKELKLKDKIVYDDDFTFIEPLELPSNSNSNNISSQLRSNLFIQNTHTDSLTISLQYTFVCDLSVPIIKAFYKYARYGTLGFSKDTMEISPNMIYEVKEIRSSWGDIEINTIIGKIVGNIELGQTESDTMTLNINLQVQGEN